MILTILISGQAFGQSQGVSITLDNSPPDESAMLDVKHPNKGMLIPRVALTGINDVATVPNAANGLFVFSENGNVPDGLYYWNNDLSKWTYVVISWGNGGGASTFHVPDLRGQFFRVVDNPTGALAAGEDPYANSRVAKYTGGNSSGFVGSYQTDELKSHNHTLQAGHTTTAYGAYPFIQSQNVYFESTAVSNTGGSETRSKNAHVNYIIKY